MSESVPKRRTGSERPGRPRRRFGSCAGILREHLIEKVAVADLFDKHGLQPTFSIADRKT